MRWYHWITVYMIIIGFFALGFVGDQLGGWFVLSCIVFIVGGVLLTKYLPRGEEG